MFHKISRFFYCLVNKPAIIVDACVLLLSPIIPDKLFLRILFRLRMGYWMNFSNPKTFNEKLQWLKIYDRKPEYTRMVDKVKVKEYITHKIGKEYIIPTLGIWNNPNDIDLSTLPNKFVLKCSHNSGGLFICKNKSSLTKDDWEDVKINLKRSLKTNFYLLFREWPYKNVDRKILAEQYIEDESMSGLIDYKFFCFNGQPKYVLVATERNKNVKFDFFDTKFVHMPFKQEYDKLSDKLINKPRNFDDMLKVATILSKDIPHVRVDLYNIKGKIYFGEITFFNNSGFEGFVPKEWDNILGDYIKLPTKN